MSKKVIFPLLILFLCQLIVQQIYAVQAYPFPITVTQPDGTSLSIRLHGDEFHHYQTSEDGYLLKENAKGFLTYATINAAGEVVESSVIAHDITTRALTETRFLKSVNQSAIIQKIQIQGEKTPQKSKVLKVPGEAKKVFPSIGSPKSLVILVNFSDKSFVTPNPQVAFTDLLNQDSYTTNGGTGSARDYFMSSTYGKFSPNFVVVGPVTLPQTLDFYGKNDANGNDLNPVQMIVDACTAANAAGVDFTQYDTDNDGVIDNVFIYYAGYNEAEGGPVNSIWPHRSGVYPIALYPNDYNYNGSLASVTFDGKRVLDYACTSELRGSTGTNMCGIGTFCHEFGHVLGLPDYYDTSGKQSHTLDTWDIMSGGNYNNLGRTPPTYSVYDRFFLGYLTPEQKSTTTTNLALNPLYQGKTPPANTLNQAFLFSATSHNLNGSNPSPTEFFMVEYRQKIGWDLYLPSEGLCIWHIDYDQTAWNNNVPNDYTGTTQTLASHMHVYLQPLIGSMSTPGTAFPSGSFTPLTWSGIDINRGISNITPTGNNITFNLMSPYLTTTGSFVGFATTLGSPSVIQTIKATGKDLTGNLNLNLLNNVNYEVKLPTDNAWSKSLSLIPNSGNVNATIQVRFNPTATGVQTDQLKFSDTGLTTTNIDLSGICTIGPYSPVIFVGKIDSTLQFSAAKLNDNNTKTINIQTTDLISNLSIGVTGSEASLFTLSDSNVTKEAVNGSGGYSITITFKPTTIGNHSATLTLSGGGLDPDRVIQLMGSGI